MRQSPLTASILVYLLGFLIAAPSLAKAVPNPPASPAKSRAPGFSLDGDSGRVRIPLHRAGSPYCLQGTVNDQESGWFIVDTGTSVSIIDYDAATRLKLPVRVKDESPAAKRPTRPGEMVVGYDNLRIGGARVGSGVAATIDLAPLQPLLGVRPLGILGNDLLGQQPFSLDLVDGVLTIYDRAAFKRPEGGVSYPIELSGGLVGIRAAVDGYDGWFIWDTGSAGGLTLYDPFARLGRLIERRTNSTWHATAVGGAEVMRHARMDSLLLFGQTTRDIWTDVPASPGRDNVTFAGIIGMQLLDGATYTVDESARTLWVQRPPDPSAEELLKRLGPATTADLAGVTPLMRVAQMGRRDVAEKLLDAGAVINARGYAGQNALVYAIRAGQPQTASLLLGRGAEPNTTTTIRSMTALHFAAQAGDAETCALLVARGADVNANDASGDTPLFRAADGGHLAALQALLKAGADVAARSRGGMTALTYAAGAVETDVAATLLRAGADARTRANNGWTPLMMAAGFGRTGTATVLLDAGAAIDEAESTGGTALMLAAKQNRLEVVKLLLERGADVTLKSQEGKTAKDYAKAGAPMVFRELLLHEVNARSPE